MNGNNFELLTANIRAYVVNDTDGIIVYSTGKNGVMVKALNRETAIEKFKSALDMTFAVRNLHYFNTVVKADTVAKEAFVKEFKHRGGKDMNIEYIDAVSA